MADCGESGPKAFDVAAGVFKQLIGNPISQLGIQNGKDVFGFSHMVKP
jgi:hypothetical protein